MNDKTKDTCSSCRFAEADQHNIGAYQCRRRAPVAVPIQTPQGVGGMSMFPVVKSDGWCGEFTAKTIN